MTPHLAPPQIDPLLSPVELSEHLGIPKKTLYGWHSRGEGPRVIRVGKHLRYRKSDVDSWLDQQASGPTMEAG